MFWAARVTVSLLRQQHLAVRRAPQTPEPNVAGASSPGRAWGEVAAPSRRTEKMNRGEERRIQQWKQVSSRGEH